ncbi:MAG: hypothetical protein AB8G17_21340 [Gammaproteobacteria bacterium]
MPDVATVAPHTSQPDANAPSVLMATQSRHAIAVDALTNNKPFAVDAVSQYLETFATTFDSIALREPANGLLDAKVLEVIDAFEPSLKQYREVISAAGQCDVVDDLVEPIVHFFQRVLVHKQAGSERMRQCVLWADGHRFIIRELFLTTVAILLKHEAFGVIAKLVDAGYCVANSANDGDQRFVACDGYVKTLDEFRNRRLQLHRLSVSSDLLRQRVDPVHCDFDALMQADFILCLRSLVCEQNFFVRWYPRTLVYAEQFQVTGFDLFITSASPARFGPLAALFNATDMTDLLTRFEAVRDAWALDRWEIGGGPLDFLGFMGQNNAALRH